MAGICAKIKLNSPMDIHCMHHILYVGLSFMLQGVVKFYRKYDLFEKEKKTIEEHLSIYKVSSSKIVINLPRTYEKLHGEPYRFSRCRVSSIGTELEWIRVTAPYVKNSASSINSWVFFEGGGGMKFGLSTPCSNQFKKSF